MAEKPQANADKLKVLSAVMDKIEKDFGKGSIMRMNSTEVNDIPVIPTGSITLDMALGVGGYPKDNTSGCTLEAKSLRDGKAELAAMGFRIVGVSPDSERSHRNFCAKHELNFTLLADTDHSVCEAFGVWAEKSMYGRKYMGVLRTTFVIDAEGRIEKIFTKVDTKNHYRQIIDSYK